MWLQLDSNPEPLSSKTNTVWPNGWVFVYELSGPGFEFSCSHLNFSKEFLDIQATIECGFTLKVIVPFSWVEIWLVNIVRKGKHNMLQITETNILERFKKYQIFKSNCGQ